MSEHLSLTLRLDKMYILTPRIPFRQCKIIKIQQHWFIYRGDINEFMACETMTSNNSININVCVLNLVRQMSASVFNFFCR